MEFNTKCYIKLSCNRKMEVGGSMKNKIKKISKYVVNTLNMINMLILVLSPIWGWNLDTISKTIIGVAGVISTYLVSGKLFELKEEEK